jgi:hypothetical protein
MATSPLDPANTSFRSDRSLGRGHGTRELGPSDSSDSGSDLIGASEGVGDLELDSDSDRAGTGERMGAGSAEEVPEAADISPDRIERIQGDDETDDETDAG